MESINIYVEIKANLTIAEWGDLSFIQMSLHNNKSGCLYAMTYCAVVENQFVFKGYSIYHISNHYACNNKQLEILGVKYLSEITPSSLFEGKIPLPYKLIEKSEDAITLMKSIIATNTIASLNTDKINLAIY